MIWIATNYGAGNGTSATVLRIIFYYLLKYPQTLQALLSAIQTAARAGNLSKIATWKECLGLPYLDSCVKEAERIHSPIGLTRAHCPIQGGNNLRTVLQRWHRGWYQSLGRAAGQGDLWN